MPEASIPRSSTNHLTTSQHSNIPPLGLAEQFNQPLRPHIWTSRKRKWTRQELDREREEFFDTRVTGRQEIWGALRIVIGLLEEGEMETAQGILDASGITVPTGDLKDGAYDEAGNFYQMPEHVISDPENLMPEEKAPAAQIDAKAEETDEDEIERRREEKGKAVLKIGESIKVKARLSDRGGPDVVIELSKDQNIRVLIRRIQDEAEVNVSTNNILLLIY